MGITGLVGAGRSEIIRALFGIDKFTSGEIMLEGKPYIPSIENSMKNGLGFVPEDRRSQGIIPEINVNQKHRNNKF